jgi:hypothetical protein
MKKIFLILLGVATISFANAQEKVYATKSGVIKFTATGGVEAIEATNSQAICRVNSKTGQIGFLALIKGFKFDNSLMEDHFNENYMESTKFPKADFKGNISNIASVDFAKDGVYNITVTGDLTIHGVTKKITEKGTITVKAGKVVLNSKFNIKVKEYGIKGEYIGDKIASEVVTTVSCKLD